MKSEPEVFSIADLERDGKTAWTGVRNYQARNFMRDDMRVGDAVLFYHSNAEPTGMAGLARVCSAAHPDATALDPKSDVFDPKATAANPIWMCVDVAFVEQFPRVVTLEELRSEKALADMLVLQRGMRLSVQPVSAEHFRKVVSLARAVKSR